MASGPTTRLEMGEVATIWLDYKPLNALHPQRECMRLQSLPTFPS